MCFEPILDDLSAIEFYLSLYQIVQDKKDFKQVSVPDGNREIDGTSIILPIVAE